MSEKSLARQQMSLVRKSLRKLYRTGASLPEHLAWLGQSLRENREIVAAMDDAMCARAQAAAAALPDEARDWNAEWDAIEGGLRWPKSKLLALRTLFNALLEQLTRSARPPAQSGAIEIPVAPGELLDRLGILEIKLERIRDEAKLRNVRREHELLSTVSARAVPASDAIALLRGRLKAVNEKIWQLEDDIRQHERDKEFGSSFLALARAVYHTNDERAAIKRQINDALKSEIVEEKSYQAY